MSEHFAPRIAILADTSLQRHVLQQCLVGGGYRVVLNSDPSKLELQVLVDCETDLWLLDLMQLDESPLVDALLERSDVPVLFGEGCAPERHSENYPRWERRLFGKLKHLVGDPTQAVGPSLQSLLDSGQRSARVELPTALAATPLTAGEPARQVWLLAASLGGPAAVKAFLDALPGGLPVGFVYAQHIDASFESALPQAVGRHSQWHVNLARAGDSVRCGEVVVAPIVHELGFAPGGAMQVAGHGWPEPYSPSIDQMMLNLAQHFGSRCGVIAFSGMGNDGSSAAAYVRRQGGQIWTQSAESCACASMPDGLRDGGHSQYSGDPRALAEQLVNHLAAQCVHLSTPRTPEAASTLL